MSAYTFFDACGITELCVPKAIVFKVKKFVVAVKYNKEICHSARSSNIAVGGILRYSSCRPTNSRFPYAFAAWALTLY